jgi:DNA polymerase-3 subunit chi
VWPAEPAAADHNPVLISSGEVPASHRDVLVNLGTEAPAGFEAFARVCEIVATDEAAKRAARARWRRYRDAGLEPRSHNL